MTVLRMNAWLYWKVAFPVAPGRAIQDALAGRAEQKTMRVSLIGEAVLLLATNRTRRIQSYRNINTRRCADLTVFAC